MKHMIILLVSLALSKVTMAQSSQLLRLDTAALNGIPTGVGLPMLDGGSALQLRESYAFSLWKCDAAGVPQWRNLYPSVMTYAQGQMTRASNGDIFIAYTKLAGSTSGDTAAVGFDLWRIAPDGSPVWHKDVNMDTLGGLNNNPVELFIKVVENDQSEIFVLSSIRISGQRLAAVTKIGPAGDVLWSNWIGNPADPSGLVTFPNLSEVANYELHLAPDPVGGCRLTTPASTTGENAIISSIDADGSLAWIRRFDYLGGAMPYFFGKSAVDMDGTVLFLTQTDSENEGTHVIRISVDGDLVSVYRYNPPFRGDFQNDQGSLFLLHGGSLVTTMDQAGVFTSTAGNALFPPGADSTYQLSTSYTLLKDGLCCHSGSFLATPIGPGLPMASPSFRSFSLSDADACGSSLWPQMFQNETLPNSIFTCIPIPSMTSEPMAYSASDGPLTFETRPLLPAVDLCSFFAGTSEHAVGPSAFEVFPNPSAPGGTLYLRCDGASRFAMYTSTGAHLRDVPTSKGLTATFSCEGLTAGLYPVVAFGKDGRRIATAKLEVR